MKLKHIKAYWNAWVLKEAEGDPFSFISGRDDGGDSEDGSQGQEQEGQEPDQEEDQEEDQELDQEETFTANKSPIPSTSSDIDIDSGIPLPSQSTTPALRTMCLQHLVPRWGSTGKTFHALIELVDALKVGSVLIDNFYYLTLF